MSRYHYKAVNPAGEVVQGEMDAASESAVVSQLQSLGMLPIRAEAAERTSGIKDILSIDVLPARRGLARHEVTVLTRELATLLGAGIELEQALEILQSLAERSRVEKLLSQLLRDVREGSSLADALANHGDSFPTLYVSMVRAGEAGGALEPIFSRIAAFMEESQSVAEEVKSALVYPVVLLSTAVLSVVVLVGFVIPRFKPLFASAGRELPLPTRVVMFMGDAIEAHWWLLVTLAFAIALLLRVLLRTPSMRLRWDAGLLRLPLVGGLLTKVETSRLTRTLGALLSNGVPMLPALDIAGDTIGNSAYRHGLSHLGDAVKAGRRLSEELGRASVFPRLGSSLVRVGEESGRLEDMLLKTADIYDQETRRSIQRALALLTPLLTVLLGLLIAGIIFSILLAILSINEVAL